MFQRKGLFIVPADKITEDRLFEIASEAGADDVKPVGDNFEILCDLERFTEVSDRLEAAQIECDKQVTRIPQNTVELDLEPAREILKFLDALDDHDDVQNVSSNLSMSDEVMAQI